MEYYSATKRDEILPFAKKTGMDLKGCWERPQREGCWEILQSCRSPPVESSFRSFSVKGKILRCLALNLQPANAVSDLRHAGATGFDLRLTELTVIPAEALLRTVKPRAPQFNRNSWTASRDYKSTCPGRTLRGRCACVFAQDVGNHLWHRPCSPQRTSPRQTRHTQLER